MSSLDTADNSTTSCMAKEEETAESKEKWKKIKKRIETKQCIDKQKEKEKKMELIGKP